MKSALALTAFVLGLGLNLNANAEIQSPVINVKPVVLAEVKNPKLGAKSVALLSTGDVQITNLAGFKSSLPLNENDFVNMQKEAAELADVAVVTKQQFAVCMMMPVGPQSSLYVQGKLILSPKGCYVPNETFPVKSSDEKLAERLKEDLASFVSDPIIQ